MFSPTYSLSQITRAFVETFSANLVTKMFYTLYPHSPQVTLNSIRELSRRSKPTIDKSRPDHTPNIDFSSILLLRTNYRGNYDRVG